MHALETAVTVEGFQTAFATRSAPAWHMLGTVFPADEVVTTAQMLKKAHLNGWNVRTVPLSEMVTGMNVADGINAVVRDNPFYKGETDILATVGSRYNVFQNEEAFVFGDNLLDGGQWETAGSIKGGKVIFGSLKLDREMQIGKQDAVDAYLLIQSSHDGSSGLMASITPVRVVCQNTLNMANSNVMQSFKIRHTSGIAGKVAVAREVLGLANSYFDAFELEAEAMIATAVSDAEFDKIVETLYPAPTVAKGKSEVSKISQTKYDNLRSEIGDIWKGNTSVDTMSGVTGTAWGALNALTEQADWYRNPRNGDASATAAAAAGFDPVANAKRNKIATVVRAFAGV